jgi:hypothetical protein
MANFAGNHWIDQQTESISGKVRQDQTEMNITNRCSCPLLRLAKFPDKDFLLCHNFRYGEGKKEAREATEAPPEGGRPFRAG